MSCSKTISAWKLGKKPNGKDNIVFRPPTSSSSSYIQLPCGKCDDCRLEYSRQWAMRCMHEAQMYENNCFITLTFNDDFVDSRNPSLDKKMFVNFMKRLRKHLSADASASSRRVRFFHAAEYGEIYGRPHHHAILFGFDFPDKVLRRITKANQRCYTSALLEKLWTDPKSGKSYGFHEIGQVSFESCAYVARYCLKKVVGESAEDHYTIMDDQGNFYKKVPEFCTMSRRPGIGRDWYEKYKDTDVWAGDSVNIRGDIQCRPPRYYGSLYELTNPQEWAIIKEKRLKKASETDDNRFERQQARAVITRSNIESRLKRRFD